MTPQLSLRQKQSIFAYNVALFILEAYRLGFELTGGEWWRNQLTQQQYVATGRSKTLDSRHLIRMALDFNVFYRGRMLFAPPDNPTPARTEEKYIEDLEIMRPLGEYWESLHTDNVWGGDWNRNNVYDEKLKDPYHIEMKP